MISLNTTATIITCAMTANTGASFDWWTIGWSFVNLGIIVFAIHHFFGKTINGLFIKRHDDIQSAITSSQAALSAANQEHTAAQDALDNIDQTISGYQDQLAKDLENIRLNGAIQADQLKKSLADQINDQIKTDKANMAKKLMNNMVEEVISQAQDDLAKKATSEAHNQRIDDLLNALNGLAGQEVLKTINGDYK